MTENSQLLVPDPANQITFLGPFNNGTQSVLNLTNPSKSLVHFKVMTTNQEAFSVKPKVGVVKPYETVSIKIRLRKFELEFKVEKQPKIKICTIEDPEEKYDTNTVWSGESPKLANSLKFYCAFVENKDDESPDKVKIEDSEIQTDHFPEKDVDVDGDKEEDFEDSPSDSISLVQTKTVTGFPICFKLVTLGTVMVFLASVIFGKFFGVDSIPKLF